MKIAMLGHKRIPSREGGVEVVVEELATRMVEMGHSVTCYNRSENFLKKSRQNDNRQKVYKGVFLKKAWTISFRGASAFSAAFSAAAATCFRDYDVIHFHAEGPCIMLWLPKLFRKKCVATIHGLDHRRAKWGKFAKKIILLGEKCAAKYADGIIVLSRDVQQYFKDNYGRDTVYIPNGVNRPKNEKVSEIKARWGLEQRDYILFLGRLVPEKGPHYLIEAYQLLHTDKKLVIAGESSDTGEYVRGLYKQAGENKNIIFTGFVQGKLMDELYSNAYLYCLPSDLEGMPLTLLEAMSYGNCCLVSDIGECVDVAGDYAVNFSAGSMSDLREKLQYLSDNPEKAAEYRKKSADYICSKYNWNETLQDTLGLYERVMH